MAVVVEKAGKKENILALGELGAVVKQITKDYGDKHCFVGSTADTPLRIPTGIFPLDLGITGGVPRGRITIMVGPESSGKTLIALKTARELQRRCGRCQSLKEDCKCKEGVLVERAVLLDAEHAFDPIWARRLGVDLDNLVVLSPDSAEQAIDMAQAVLHAREVGLLIIDSIAALNPNNEIVSSAEKMQVGGNSMLVSKLMKKIGTALSSEEKRGHTPAVILINQIRHKIGVMYGDPETMSGGNALKFASSLTIRISGKNKVVKEVDDAIPAIKEVNISVKKYRVPILGLNMSFDLCLLPHDGLKIGDTPTWNTVSSYLKDYGFIAKGDKGGWVCNKETYPTLAAICDRYKSEPAYQDLLKKMVIETSMKKAISFDEVALKGHVTVEKHTDTEPGEDPL